MLQDNGLRRENKFTNYRVESRNFEKNLKKVIWTELLSCLETMFLFCSIKFILIDFFIFHMFHIIKVVKGKNKISWSPLLFSCWIWKFLMIIEQLILKRNSDPCLDFGIAAKRNTFIYSLWAFDVIERKQRRENNYRPFPPVDVRSRFFTELRSFTFRRILDVLIHSVYSVALIC